MLILNNLFNHLNMTSNSNIIPRISDYEIQEKLGVGSYAIVYKAKHKKNQTFHAIKCVEKSSLSQSASDNLVTEIRLLKTLSHKHIVGLDDFFWDEKFIYIVLEYCNAGNLSQYIRQQKSLPESTCKYFIRQLALAVKYMRSNDVSHLDLKPQNLLLTKTTNIYVLKVADFGFAQHLELGEINSKLKGSPLYMAPEIVLKQSYDATADLWSIGVILYECLFGKAPYSSKSFDELLLKIKQKDKIRIPKTSKISKECEDLLARLLQHEPSKRIAFQEFFEHPFLDLAHYPSDENLEKAASIVTKAVRQDELQNYKDAYELYCKALQYLVPLVTQEPDASKRQALRNRVITYMNRAEEIKTNCGKQSKAIINNINLNDTNNSNSLVKRRSLEDLIEPDIRFKQLYALSSSSPQIKHGLDIGRQGELYLYEKNLNSALDSFKSALGVLVPLLNAEPKGERRLMLHQQIDLWMKEAECINSLLSAKNLDEEQIMSIYSCNIM